MSTLASKVAALERHRRAVARELAAAIPGTITTSDLGPTGDWNMHGERIATLAERRVSILLDGRGTFDVHAAREHARTLVALGQHRAKPAHIAVLSDWQLEHPHLSPTASPMARAVSGHGLSFARLGQRILDMLEGQPSECRRCDGLGEEVVYMGGDGGFSTPEDVPCEACHGTGHNLRGVLPPVEWVPVLRRKARDTSHAIQNHGGHGYPAPAWQDALYEAGRESGWTLRTRLSGHSCHSAKGFARLREVEEIIARADGRELRLGTHPSDTLRTRVCPRGEHRTPAVEVIERNGRRVELRDQMRGWIPKDSPAAGPARRRPGPECLPAWARGESEHARQRRERDARRGEGRHWRGFEWTAELQGTIVE